MFTIEVFMSRHATSVKWINRVMQAFILDDLI